MEPASLLLDAREFGRKLCSWYVQNARQLPFRQTKDPYKIWISEVMLQQTRVKAMTGSYEAFIDRFPDLASLADATVDEVLAHWKGLGYYRRARNLHAAARQMIDQSFTTVPTDYDQLTQFSGIGPYTASAVASISEDHPYAVVDGNVKRVIARLFNQNMSDRAVKEEAQKLLIESKQLPSVLNQAMMELGATVCLPSFARCNDCAVRSHCAAFAYGGSEYASTIPKRNKQSPITLDVSVFGYQKKMNGTTLYGLVKNSNGLFLKEEPMFPYRASSYDEVVYESDLLKENHDVTNYPKAGTFSHSIMNWRIKASVFLLSVEGLGKVQIRSMQWFTEHDINQKLHSSFSHKTFTLLRKSVEAQTDDTMTDQPGRVKKSRNLKAKKKNLHQ